jgi:hypothetical protein
VRHDSWQCVKEPHHEEGLEGAGGGAGGGAGAGAEQEEEDEGGGAKRRRAAPKRVGRANDSTSPELLVLFPRSRGITGLVSFCLFVFFVFVFLAKLLVFAAAKPRRCYR